MCTGLNVLICKVDIGFIILFKIDFEGQTPKHYSNSTRTYLAHVDLACCNKSLSLLVVLPKVSKVLNVGKNCKIQKKGKFCNPPTPFWCVFCKKARICPIVPFKLKV